MENYSGKMFSFSKDFPDKNSKLETLAEVEDDSQEKNERSFSKLKIIILDKQKPIVWVFFASADMNCNSGPPSQCASWNVLLFKLISQWRVGSEWKFPIFYFRKLGRFRFRQIEGDFCIPNISLEEKTNLGLSTVRQTHFKTFKKVWMDQYGFCFVQGSVPILHNAEGEGGHGRRGRSGFVAYIVWNKRDSWE